MFGKYFTIDLFITLLQSTRSILSAFPDTDQLAKYHDEHSISTTNRGAAVVRVSIAQLADGRTRCAVCLEDGSLLLITMPIFGDKMRMLSIVINEYLYYC